jgi:hypothetical protein
LDLRALQVGASGARPIRGVRPDAPTNETIEIGFAEYRIPFSGISFSSLRLKGRNDFWDGYQDFTGDDHPPTLTLPLGGWKV